MVPRLSRAEIVMYPVCVIGRRSSPCVLTLTLIVPLLVPVFVESINQLWLPGSTDAVHETGYAQFPVSRIAIDCCDGLLCKREAENVRLLGVTCKTHGCTGCVVG